MSEQEPGAMEKAKGLAKEAVGAVIRSDEMKEKGRAERGKEPAQGQRVLQKSYRGHQQESRRESLEHQERSQKYEAQAQV